MSAGPTATMYVCGITPYDATHLGHAATYLAFDLIHRLWLDLGHDVHYVQNITDVDDPLFERANRDGIDWRDLGRPRDRAVPRGHDRAAGVAAARIRRGNRGDGRGRRAGREDAGLRGRVRRRRRRIPRRVLPRRRHAAVRLRVRLRPRHHARAVRRTRRRPGPVRQDRPTRRVAVARRAARGAELAVAVRARPAGLARRVRGDRAQPHRQRPGHPGRRQRPDLPAPRVHRRARRIRHAGKGDSPGTTCTRA